MARTRESGPVMGKVQIVKNLQGKPKNNLTTGKYINTRKQLFLVTLGSTGNVQFVAFFAPRDGLAVEFMEQFMVHGV